MRGVSKYRIIPPRWIPRRACHFTHKRRSISLINLRLPSINTFLRCKKDEVREGRHVTTKGVHNWTRGHRCSRRKLTTPPIDNRAVRNEHIQRNVIVLAMGAIMRTCQNRRRFRFFSYLQINFDYTSRAQNWINISRVYFVPQCVCVCV